MSRIANGCQQHVSQLTALDNQHYLPSWDGSHQVCSFSPNNGWKDTSFVFKTVSQAGFSFNILQVWCLYRSRECSCGHSCLHVHLLHELAKEIHFGTANMMKCAEIWLVKKISGWLLTCYRQSNPNRLYRRWINPFKPSQRVNVYRYA